MSNDERIIDLDEAHKLGASLLAEGRTVRVKLGGSSMFPFLRQGDVAQIKPVPITELKRGQVIVFEHKGRWTAHRLVAIRNKATIPHLLAHGDSVRRADPPILKEYYLGVVKGFSRNGKEHKVDGLMNELYARMMLTFRPFLQLSIRLFLRVSNRVRRL